MARGIRRVRRTKTVHRGTTIKYRDKFRPIAVKSGSHTGVPKKVRKAPQVHRPRDDIRNRGSPFMHGAAYGVSQGKSGRLSQQKFRHLTVKAAKILGYPQSQKMAMKKALIAGGGQTKLPPRRDGSGRHNRLGLTEYEKLALAVAEGKGLLK
ncbi:MAG: hypothetical protein CMB80_01415 [Flammeovirgaceae bacterium]|nr:hypothetical protein [Flammeovirgaceae bacterium]